MEHDDALQKASEDYPHSQKGVWIVKDSFVSFFTGLLKVYLVFVYEGLPTGTSAIYDYDKSGRMVCHSANEACRHLSRLPVVELDLIKQTADQLSGWLSAIATLPKERLTAALGVEPSRTKCILALQERNLLHPDGIAALFPELSPPTPTQVDLQWEWDGKKWDLRLRLETGDEWEDLGLNVLTGLIDRRYEYYRL